MFPPKSRGLIIATLADFVKSEPTKINSRRDAEIFYILILCVFAPPRELILASVNPRDSLTVSPTLEFIPIYETGCFLDRINKINRIFLCFNPVNPVNPVNFIL